jgi:hypothetical protein
MKRLALFFALLFSPLLLAPAALFAQGVFIPPQTAFKNINGIVMPIANATITVCAANAGGIPCTPVLTNTIYKDGALTQHLSNPFTSDANGNYQFAVAATAATYTVTVTSPGYGGSSYQVSVATGGGSGISDFFGNTPGPTLSSLVDPTTIVDLAGNNIAFSGPGVGKGLSWLDSSGDGCSGSDGNLNCQDANGDFFSASDGVVKVGAVSGPLFEILGDSYSINDGTATTISSTGGALTFANHVTLTGCAGGTYVKADGSGCGIPGNGLPSSPQTGDTIAYNAYGSSTWNAVLGGPRQFATIFQSIDNGAPTAYGVISGVNHSGNIANVFASATDGAGQTFSAAATASTSTVIGEDAGEGANYTQFGFGSFYRWSNRFAAGNTTNVRYWMGLTNYNTALTGCAAQSVRGNTCFAADYPSTFSIAFRFSAGTDTHWQAVTQTQTAQTVVDTGVAIDTNSHLFEFTNSGSAVNYFIDGTLVATITTNIPSSVGSAGYTPAMFWVGDNKNTATAISANEYWMTMTLK